MGIEKLKQDLQDWIESNREFYNNYVRAIRNDCANGKVFLAAYMHIYDFAMSQIPNLPESVKFGSYGNLFENYYKKYGFGKLLGMLAQVLNKDLFLYLKALKNTRKLKNAILYWVLIDDFHFFLLCKIGKCENILEEKLRNLEIQIIQNSIVLEIKDKAYWLSPHVFNKLLFEEEEKESFKQILNNLEKLEEPTNLQVVEECCDDRNGDGECNREEDVLQTPKIAKTKGRKPSISSKSLKELIAVKIQDNGKINDILQFVTEELNVADGPGLACLTIAMEYCNVIEALDGGKVTPFHALLKKVNSAICDSSNFCKSHRALCGYLKSSQKVEETKRMKIDKYVEKLQEILK